MLLQRDSRSLVRFHFRCHFIYESTGLENSGRNCCHSNSRGKQDGGRKDYIVVVSPDASFFINHWGFLLYLAKAQI